MTVILEAGRLADAIVSSMTDGPPIRAESRGDSFTTIEWLVCAVAALGFAFDLYEMLVLPVIVRPAIVTLGGLTPGTQEFNRWVGLMFYVPAVAGAVLGLVGGWLTDRFGRRRVLTWSILLYALSSVAAARAATLEELLVFRCVTVIGVSAEYVAAVAWLAELFDEPRRRERVLGVTQSAAGLGGLMATAGYGLAVTFADRLPSIAATHDPWRYALVFGLVPAIPLIMLRPFLPESPEWRRQRSAGRAALPRIRVLLRPVLRRRTLLMIVLFACTYGLASGVLLQTPRIVPGLAGLREMPARRVEQTVSAVQFIGELGVLAGRLLFALMVLRVASQRRLARGLFAVGLIVIPAVYLIGVSRGVVILAAGVFLTALLINASISLIWNALPRVYPTALRGTGEGVAYNIGARLLGTFAVVITTQLAGVMPGDGAPAQLARSAGVVAIVLCAIAFVASFALRDSVPDHASLPRGDNS